jgi:hypothetical protein
MVLPDLVFSCTVVVCAVPGQLLADELVQTCTRRTDVGHGADHADLQTGQLLVQGQVLLLSMMSRAGLPW